MTVFTKEHWEKVWSELPRAIWGRSRRVAEAWWQESQDEIVGMAHDEVVDILRALRSGDRAQAKLILAGNMTREEWDAYVTGTNKSLEDLSDEMVDRRARLLELLEDLGRRSARVIGQAAAAALGL